MDEQRPEPNEGIGLAHQKDPSHANIIEAAIKTEKLAEEEEAALDRALQAAIKTLLVANAGGLLAVLSHVGIFASQGKPVPAVLVPLWAFFVGLAAAALQYCAAIAHRYRRHAEFRYRADIMSEIASERGSTSNRPSGLKKRLMPFLPRNFRRVTIRLVLLSLLAFFLGLGWGIYYLSSLYGSTTAG